MKKIFLIGMMGLLAGVVAGVLLLLPHKGFAQTSAAPSGSADESSDPLVPPAQMYGAPTSPTITIGTSQGVVNVNNFYQSGVGAQEQYIIIKQNANYEINYDTYFSAFYIAITGTPLTTWQSAAEQDFIATLGISEADACKLTVSEGAISSAGAASSVGVSGGGQSLPLTFCGSASSTF